jgi:hypothetical protein
MAFFLPGLGELVLQAFLECFWVCGRGEPVKMMADVPGVPVVFVLVERPVGAADEPLDASPTESFFPTADVPLVLGEGQLP